MARAGAAFIEIVMRKNLPVFPHRRAGFAGAAALFPAEVTIEISTPSHVSGIQVGWGRPEFSGLLATKNGANEAQ